MGGRVTGAIGRLNHYYPWLKLVFLGAIIMGLIVTLLLLYRKEDSAGGVAEQKLTAVADLGPAVGVGEALVPGETEGVVVEASKEEKGGEVVAEKKDHTGKKLVALTFDDGPEESTTPRLLDVLKEKQAVATFFMLGNRVNGHAEVAKRAEKEGHEVESHSLRHANLGRMGEEELMGDLNATKEIFRNVLGREPRLVRPPYGAISDLMRAKIDVPMMLWSVDPRDWATEDAEVVRANVRGAVFDGSIVLMHDIYNSTVDAVAGIIDDLRADGYDLVTVMELAELRHEPLKTGVAYGKFMVE